MTVDELIEHLRRVPGEHTVIMKPSMDLELPPIVDVDYIAIGPDRTIMFGYGGSGEYETYADVAAERQSVFCGVTNVLLS